MILGVHHSAMAVPDVQVALAFYCGVPGFRVVMEAELPSGWEQMSRACLLEQAMSAIGCAKAKLPTCYPTHP